jgi:hypothetical protein
VFGTNLPAWLGPDRLADDEFRQRAVDAGITVVRMPGGSWSNAYDWRACEERDAAGCFWPWAARPSDFAAFLSATGLAGMWTVSVNDTPQSAAALVAFFNGEVGDERPIGTDRDGFEWGNVDRWASLRATSGITRPIGIALWEVGNEVYGGTPSSGGDECADFGWEDVWTCDGNEYVSGTAGHDGYLAIREAMVAIDPTIEVGAVGVADPASWSDWGNEVIEASGDALDFYVVHQYAFDGSPDPVEALGRARTMWASVVASAREALPDRVPLAVTEYNLVAFEAGDTSRTMTTALNGLFTAESLGRLVTLGVPIANHWNLANGTTGSGTDYGILDVDGGGTFPAYDAFLAWAAAGDELLEVSTDVPANMSVFGTRRTDGTVVTLLVNLGEEPSVLTAAVDGVAGVMSSTVTTWYADELDAPSLVAVPPVELDDVRVGAAVTLEMPSWSITVWEAHIDG